MNTKETDMFQKNLYYNALHFLMSALGITCLCFYPEYSKTVAIAILAIGCFWIYRARYMQAQWYTAKKIDVSLEKDAFLRHRLLLASVCFTVGKMLTMGLVLGLFSMSNFAIVVMVGTEVFFDFFVFQIYPMAKATQKAVFFNDHQSNRIHIPADNDRYYGLKGHRTGFDKQRLIAVYDKEQPKKILLFIVKRYKIENFVIEKLEKLKMMKLLLCTDKGTKLLKKAYG